MTAPQNPRVTQADRDAVQAFHRAMAGKLMADITSGKAPTFGDDAGHDGDAIHQAFARHREAAEAASKAREAALVEALGEALHGLSAMLLLTSALDDDKTHAAYEKVVALFQALTKEPDA